MRTLAQRLGVQAMSLYNHVAGKGALLDGLQERLTLEVIVPESGDEPWPETLRRAAAAYRVVALAHPRAFVLLATRPLSTPAAIAHVAPILTAVASSGFGPGQGMLLLNVFFTFLNGYLLAEVAPVPGHADVPEPDTAGAFRAALATGDLSRDVIALAEAGTSIDEPGGLAPLFSRAVDLVIAGLQPLVPDRPPGTPRP